jgi:hypothetical protein
MLPIQVSTDQILSDMLQDKLPEIASPLWALSANDREINIIVSALVQNARGAATAAHFTSQSVLMAESLIQAIDDYERIN